MPRLALALVLVWFLALFVFRSIVQWRRTGSAGIHGFSGRVGSVAWTAGVLASLGLAGGALAPLAAILEWRGGGVWFESAVLHLAGAAVALVGIAGALLAQLGMGESWRVGVDAGERTALVTTGMFARVRNPIFSFVVLSMLGLVLVLPNAWAVAALVCTVAGIDLQVRAVEEPHLRRVHGAAYDDYVARTGRFLPRSF